MQKTRIIKYFINRKGVIHMKKLFGVLLTSTLILGACSTHNGKDTKSSTSEHKKSDKVNSAKDKIKDSKLSKKNKSDNDSKSSGNSSSEQSNSSDGKQSESNDHTNGNNSDNDNKTSNSNTGNSKTSNNQSTNQTSNVNSTQQATSNQQNTTQQNNGMTQADIDEWNKTKPTTHDESQMGYGRGDYEAAREASSKVWDNPNAHVGGPSWVGKNEGYDSWAKRQQEVQENSEVLQQ